MARIYTRGKTLWIYYHYNNKLFRQSLGLKNNKQNRKLAEEMLLQKQLELKRRNHYAQTGAMLFSDAAAEFIIHKKSETKNYNNYQVVLSHFSDFLKNDIPVRSITETHIRKFKDYLASRSDHTIQNYIYHLKIFFNHLVKEKKVDDNPVKIKIKTFREDIRIITDTDYRKIRLYLFIHNKVQYRLIHFLYLTGFRKSEALNIKWEDIDFTGKIIKVRNTKAGRIDVFPLYNDLYDFLNQFKKKSGRIFTYSKDGLKFWNRALDRLQLKYSIHDLRRKFGTRMAEKELSPYELTKIMRHQNIKTSMKYYINVSIKDIGKKM